MLINPSSLIETAEQMSQMGSNQPSPQLTATTQKAPAKSMTGASQNF